MSLRRSCGFTLVELMITIAVLAILSTIAYPSFQSTIRSNRMATASNELMASLSLARSEAIKNTHGGAVCASADGTGCNGDSWADGWLVWEDRNGNGSIDTGENVLRYSQGRPSLQGVKGQPLMVGFDNRGRNRAGSAVDLTLSPDKCADLPLQRTLRVSPTGQVRLLKETCS